MFGKKVFGIVASDICAALGDGGCIIDTRLVTFFSFS